MSNKKRAKEKGFKNSLFVESFKELDKRVVYIVIFDALFYLALFGLLFFAFTSLGWSFETQKLTELNTMFFVAIARTLLILLVIFILSLMIGIFFKGLIWTKILHKKFDISFYRRFVLLNLLWIVPWAVLIVLFLFAINSEIVFWYIAGVIILFLHFTNIIYVLFEKEHKFLKILKDTFILGIKKIPHFVIPYAIITLIFLVLFYLFEFVFLSKIYLVIFILVLLVYFVWVRIYIAKVILKLL